MAIRSLEPYITEIDSCLLNVAICKHHFKENFMTYLNKYKYMLVAT